MDESTEKFVKSKDGVIYLTDWNKYHETPKISTLRHYVFYADTNGFDKVIAQTDSRIKLDEREFFKWKQKRTKEYADKRRKRRGIK